LEADYRPIDGRLTHREIFFIFFIIEKIVERH